MTTLTRGAKGKEVETWQGFLIRQGLLPDHVSGEFDQPTEDATRVFQRVAGLPASGSVDLAEMAAAIANGARSPAASSGAGKARGLEWTVFVPVVIALITLIGGIVAAWLTSENNRNLEKEKLSSTLIGQAVAAREPVIVLANLRFLRDLQLISLPPEILDQYDQAPWRIPRFALNGAAPAAVAEAPVVAFLPAGPALPAGAERPPASGGPGRLPAGDGGAAAADAPPPAPSAAARVEARRSHSQLVFVQFAGSLIREDMRHLTLSLRDDGWNVPSAELGGERVPAAASINEVRFGSGAGDAEAAQELAADVNRRQLSSRPLRAVRNNDILPGRLEVWISR